MEGCVACRVAQRRIREFVATLAEDPDPLAESVLFGESLDPDQPPAGWEELAPGSRVDRYVIEERVGEGGMAVVYRARHHSLGSLHAIKVLKIASRSIAQRLLAEGRAQATIRSRHIVSVTDVIDVRGSPGLVVEWIDGPSLERRMSRGRLTLDEVDAIARGLLSGVAAAHRAGLVHRDLKPGNILLQSGEDGLVPRVADFGLVKVLRSDAGGNDTHTDVTMGTPLYMSPEQIRSTRLVDQRTDVWALGAIFYEMLTGTPPFRGDDLMQIFLSVTEGRYRPVRELVPDAPDRMVAAIAAALQVDRDRRPADVEQLAALWTGGRGTSLPPVGPPPPPVPVAARRWGWIGLGAAALVAVGLAIWVVIPGKECAPLKSTYMPMTAGSWWRYRMTDPETQRTLEEKLLRVEHVEIPNQRVQLFRQEGSRTGYRWLERHGDVIGWVHDTWFDADGAVTKESRYRPLYTRVDETCERRRVGDTWVETYTEILASGVRKEHRVDWTVIATDAPVFVKAGNFETLQVQRVQTDAATGDLVQKQTYWFADGVGKVMEDTVSKEHEELLDFHVAP